MKSIILRSFAILLLMLLGVSAADAQLKLTLNVSSHPDPYLSTWSQRKEVAIVTIINSGTKSVDAKFDCKISKNGVLQARTKPESMKVITIPIGASQWFGEDLVPFEAVTFVGNVDQTATKTGMLPAGVYEFCVALLDPATLRQITVPTCKNFTLTSYQPPQLIEPPHKSMLGQTNRPMFRWTPVSPSPPSPPNYHIQVFEVLQGQTPITAYKVNHPILDQEGLRVTQLLWPADIELPQQGMQYVWAVQATDDQGNPFGEPKGLAGPIWFYACCAQGKNQGGLNRDSLNQHPSGQNDQGNNIDNGNPGGNNAGNNNGGNGNGNNTGGSNTNTPPVLTGNQPFTQGTTAFNPGGSRNGLTAVTPKDKARFTIKDKKPNFSWTWTKEPPGVSYYALEILQNESKKQVNLKVRGKETKWPSDMPFEEGTYFWKATAMSSTGAELGSTGGQSFSIMSNNYQIQYSVDSILCTDTLGKYRFSVTLCNTGILPITFTPSDLTALDDITGLPDPNIILTVTTPSSMVTLNSPNCITISGTIKNLGTKLTGIIQIKTKRVGGNILAAAETENDTLPTCICNKCDSIKIDTSKGKAHINPKTGHLEIQQPLTVGPDKLTGLTAEIIYVGWKPDDPKCMPCDKDPKQWGVLSSASFNSAGSATITPNEAHWNLDGTHNSGNATFEIVLPQLLDCCKLHGAVCIRYKFYFKSDPAGECYECERVICYSF